MGPPLFGLFRDHRERTMVLRKLSMVCVLSLFALIRPALACKCIGSLSPCNQTGATDVVFIGRAQATEPMFLNRWNLSGLASMTPLNEPSLDARQHPSDESITRLKNTYQKAFPDLAADQ